jgi:hypothetical protein
MKKSPKKNKRSKSGAESLVSNTNQSSDDISDVARIIASMMIGLQPYMDISMVQLMLQDAFSGPLDEEAAQLIGEEIAKKCRTTLPTDGLGDIH